MSIGELDINVWGVLLAGVASMAIGYVYYMPNVFGDRWMKLAGVDAKRFGKGQGQVMPLLFLGALLTAYILGYIMCLYQAFYNVPWLQASIVTALILWALVAANITIHNLLDQKPLQLTFITLGNRLLSLVAMGLIIGWFHP